MKKPALTREMIAQSLKPYGVALSDAQLDAVRDYVELLCQWNQLVSLTSIDDPVEIVARHFGESLFAVPFVTNSHSRLADVGSGAGFPGLPLKIAIPELEIVLFEPNAKKCAFLTEIKQRLRLERVEIVRSRYEDSRTEARSFDFICSRALGNYAGLLRWARMVIRPQGRLALWLGTDDSIRLSRTKEFVWDRAIRIPESRRRVILVGRAAGS